jgi:hypothetical protein
LAVAMLPSSEDSHALASTTAVDRFDNVHDFPRFCNIRRGEDE